MPTASVPASASPQGMPSQYASPEAMPQLNLAQHPAYQAQAAPQASAAPAAAANPWQQAFQALSASLNTPQQSQAPAQYSAYQTPTPQASTQAQWGSAQPQQWAQGGQQTYSQQASTQAYSAQEVRQLLAQQEQQRQPTRAGQWSIAKQ